MVPIAVGLGLALCLASCGGRKGLYAGPDEFAVAREAPLVVPPDFALKPPKPGAARPQDVEASTQAMQAMFGGPAPRSEAETQALDAAGQDQADFGIRSEVGDPETKVINMGSTTRDIEAAPVGSGQAASVSTQ
jgi:hypothetical protein